MTGSLRHALWLLATLSVGGGIAPAQAQGTVQDYERAGRLRAMVQGKVFKSTVVPHWIAGTKRFWYRNDLQGGRREFVPVDTAAPSKRPAFDHAQLAAALSKQLG